MKTPPGKKIRPSSERVREAIFDVLGEYVRDTRVLDLFAGTGALGMEALSRGAREAVFVDNSSQAVTLIEENLKLLSGGSRAQVIRSTVDRYLKRAKGSDPPYDLIFTDPPYRIDVKYLQQIIIEITEGNLLSSQGILVVEGPERRGPLEGTKDLVLIKRKIYGETAVDFYQRRSGGPSKGGKPSET